MDEQVFRNVMAASPAPVTVVTTMRDERPVGCTVSAFMSLSLSPRMIAVALDRQSSMLRHIETTNSVGVNVLAATQPDVALQFASSVPDRFAGITWWREGGVPRLLGTTAWLRCRLAGVVDAGDHRLLMGEVVDAAYSQQPPMVYAERLFGGHSGLQERSLPLIIEQLAAFAR